MKRLKPKDNVTEVKCPACDGTGFPKVKQPIEASRKIYPAPCRQYFWLPAQFLQNQRCDPGAMVQSDGGDPRGPTADGGAQKRGPLPGQHAGAALR